MEKLVLVLFVCLAAARAAREVLGIQCVPITRCPSVYKLLEKRPVLPHVVEFIRNMSCGFEHLEEKVWCVDVKDGKSDKDFRSYNEENDTETTPAAVEETTISIKSKVAELLPGDQECGTRVDNKIVGGEETDLDEHPWLVLLQYENPKTHMLNGICGGVLIGSRYVLTAAHCIARRGKPTNVVLGEYSIQNVTDCIHIPFGDTECAPKTQIIEVDEAIVHPDWLTDKRPFYNDIALLRLTRNVEFSDFVKPICLPSANFTVTKKMTFEAAGWGITEKGHRSDIKKKVTLPIVSREDCTSILSKNISLGQICAGGVKGKDTCKGDSGGPLMGLDFATGVWSLTGIVSLGIGGCGDEGYPAIYTYVPHYLDWIYESIQ